MNSSFALPALLAGLIGTVAAVGHAAPAKVRKVPGMHKVNDVTLKRGIVKLEARPVAPRATAAKGKGKSKTPPTENMSLNFAFPPAAMHGDDVAFTCTGEFPRRLEVVVTHELRGKRGRATKHTFEPKDGRLEFIVATEKLARGTLQVAIETGESIFGSCSLTREKVETETR